jgi:hypothetical protein
MGIRRGEPTVAARSEAVMGERISRNRSLTSFLSPRLAAVRERTWTAASSFRRRRDVDPLLSPHR